MSLIYIHLLRNQIKKFWSVCILIIVDLLVHNLDEKMISSEKVDLEFYSILGGPPREYYQLNTLINTSLCFFPTSDEPPCPGTGLGLKVWKV